jgi:hypothetical protein
MNAVLMTALVRHRIRLGAELNYRVRGFDAGRQEPRQEHERAFGHLAVEVPEHRDLDRGTIGDAPPGSEPVSRAGAPGVEVAAAPEVVQGSFATIPPAVLDESPPIRTSIPPGSEATEPRLPIDEALALKVIPSGPEPADALPPRNEKLPAPTASPSEPAGPTLLQEGASGIPNSTAPRAEQIGHERDGTVADSADRTQRDTNAVTVMHHAGNSLQPPSAQVRRRSALPEQCQATQDTTRCVPLRRIRTRGP